MRVESEETDGPGCLLGVLETPSGRGVGERPKTASGVYGTWLGILPHLGQVLSACWRGWGGVVCKTAATGLVRTACQGVGSETTANLKAD